MIIKRTDKTAGLLEQMSELVGCQYLSDLREPQYHKAIRHILPRLQPEHFSAEEWNDAIAYLTGNKHKKDTNCLRAHLLNHIASGMLGKNHKRRLL